MAHPDTIYKITSVQEWKHAEEQKVFTGAAIDIADGFIHFSTAQQAKETAEKHFAGQDDLLLVAVDATLLGDKLKWEVSRNADLFPHLYGDLDLGCVLWAKPMPLLEDGSHALPLEEG